MKAINKIVVVGATGAVGGTVLHYLAAKGWPARDLFCVASSASRHKTLRYRDQDVNIIAVEDFDFSCTQLAFFAAGSLVARNYAQKAVQMGNWVIDKSSCFRNDPHVPLMILSVNGALLDKTHPCIISVPNCSTIPLAMVLKPIAERYGLTRVEVATYQAVSGAGAAGSCELSAQLTAYPATHPPQCFTKPILNNVIASIDQLSDSGYTLEELKLHIETRKILHLPDLIVNATAVRVPVMQGHSEAVFIETKAPVDLPTIIALLNASLHVTLLTMPELPNPLEHATEGGTVWVGRVRQLPGDSPNRLSLWLVSNNLQRGAALTAIEIAEALGAFA